MRYIVIVIFLLAFAVLNYCLLVPIVNPGLSWEEAALGFLPSALIALICFLFLLVGIGLKSVGTGNRAIRLWALALVWSLIVGGIVIYATAVSHSQQTGMYYGLAVLGFAGISVIGLIASLLMKKKVAGAVR
jgi:hypothetical protein